MEEERTECMDLQLVDDVAVARRLKLHPQTLRNWRQQHKGPPFLKLGYACRYRWRDVEAWLNEHKHI